MCKYDYDELNMFTTVNGVQYIFNTIDDLLMANLLSIETDDSDELELMMDNNNVNYSKIRLDVIV